MAVLLELSGRCRVHLDPLGVEATMRTVKKIGAAGIGAAGIGAAGIGAAGIGASG
jgi:hypothetical protein